MAGLRWWTHSLKRKFARIISQILPRVGLISLLRAETFLALLALSIIELALCLWLLRLSKLLNELFLLFTHGWWCLDLTH